MLLQISKLSATYTILKRIETRQQKAYDRAMPDVFEAPADRDQRFRDENTTTATVEPTPTMPPTPVEPMLSQDAHIPATPSFTKMQRIKNKITRMNLFTSFCENPHNIRFETQESDEVVLIFMRKSNFLNLGWITLGIFLAFVPGILYLLRGFYLEIAPPTAYIVLLIPFYYILVATYAFVHFMIWYYNAAMVTNKRVIDIDFHQLVMKEVDETKLSLVQDVSYRQDGVFENLFNYGYVLIQTAGTIDNFEFHGLPNPERVVEVIQRLIGGRRLYEP